jgi:hypothetical protein
MPQDGHGRPVIEWNMQRGSFPGGEWRINDKAIIAPNRAEMTAPLILGLVISLLAIKIILFT